MKGVLWMRQVLQDRQAVEGAERAIAVRRRSPGPAKGRTGMVRWVHAPTAPVNHGTMSAAPPVP
jgi:hypothetical protein